MEEKSKKFSFIFFFFIPSLSCFFFFFLEKNRGFKLVRLNLRF